MSATMRHRRARAYVNRLTTSIDAEWQILDMLGLTGSDPGGDGEEAGEESSLDVDRRPDVVG